MHIKNLRKRRLFNVLYGVNAGAFFLVMLCGYMGEKISWSWDWSSGILCYVECYSFIYTGHFGDIGLKPTAASKQESKDKAAAEDTPANVVRDRIIAVLIFSVFTVLLDV
jgi:POT family proton-dependent oligopeptide transporter